MFGVGMSELVVIAVVALLVFGPSKLPEIMRQAGKLFVQARRLSMDVKANFDQVIREAEDELNREERAKIQKLMDATVKTKIAENAALSAPSDTVPNLPMIDQHHEQSSPVPGEHPHHADPHHNDLFADGHHHHSDDHHSDPHHSDHHQDSPMDATVDKSKEKQG